MPAVGLLQLAGLVFGGAGKAALAMPEQLAFDQVFGDGRAIHFDERLGAARAAVVNGVRHQFLAAAALPIDQHPSVSRGHQRQLLPQRLHGNAFADDLQLAPPLFLEALHFQFELALLQRVLHHHHYFFDGERFLQEIECAQLGGLHGGFDGAVAGNDHHHRPAGERDLLQTGQRLQSVHPRQPDVQQDQDHRRCARSR